MHPEAFDWVRRHAPTSPVSVVDVGGRDVNGTVRGLFNSTSYTSVDLFPGPCVDIVADFCDVELPPVDVVVCCEVAEHAENWVTIVEHAAACLRPGGRFIFTAAGPYRAPHSATDGGPVQPGEWYRNIDPYDLAEVLDRFFTWREVELVDGVDVRAVAWKDVA